MTWYVLTPLLEQRNHLLWLVNVTATHNNYGRKCSNTLFSVFNTAQQIPAPTLGSPTLKQARRKHRPGQKKQSPLQALKAIMKECMKNEAYDQGGNQHWPMNLRNSMPTTSPP